MTWTGGQLDLMRGVGDRLADDTVAAIFERGDLAAVHSMMRTLVHNDQLVPDAFPEEVRSYLEQDPLPAGVDMARVERAQDFFQLWGVQISLSLFCRVVAVRIRGRQGREGALRDRPAPDRHAVDASSRPVSS